ncbi:hypothetical protein LEP1GSC043_0941 [Leptospira weilii str. Ecochallenge]|uniref:Uncharacterized protein n=2 Tax=Leptospira weilii TaxID=28184 RepID=N1U166_9LEPT|nr:hypothetical protein LEP1GSC051_1099 [Leptospira sp. P2653]EMN45745.1 hypothetical protein LEP1GSC086_2564 [Leptospira weilii str. LNT 1234]EMN88724.1 hypothetical protein LEP1GSC108_1455 [Leptospira weilii str. UI 13098]EMY14263.1 hypothetical protein LEP1GSC043_0941 [Leptospira weilii str. Ecochallenge]
MLSQGRDPARFPIKNLESNQKSRMEAQKCFTQKWIRT